MAPHAQNRQRALHHLPRMAFKRPNIAPSLRDHLLPSPLFGGRGGGGGGGRSSSVSSLFNSFGMALHAPTLNLRSRTRAREHHAKRDRIELSCTTLSRVLV